MDEQCTECDAANENCVTGTALVQPRYSSYWFSGWSSIFRLDILFLTRAISITSCLTGQHTCKTFFNQTALNDTLTADILKSIL